MLSAREQRFQSCCYGKRPQGGSMFLGHDPGYWRNQSLRESAVPGLSVRMECARRNSQGVCPIPSYPFALDTFQFPQHQSVEGALIIGGLTLRKEAGGGSRGTFQSSSNPEAPHPLGAVGGFTAGGPTRIWRLWPGAEGSRHARSVEQVHWLAHPPHLPQLQGRPSKGPRPAQASGMWQQPRY